MKRTLSIILLVIVSAMVSACGSSVKENTLQENLGNTCPDTGLVYRVSETEDLVEYICQNGNCFAFYGAEDWCVDDIVSVIMDDNGTPEVADDIILDCRYSGWFDGSVDDWVKVN